MLRLSVLTLFSSLALAAINIVVNPNPPLVVQSVTDAVTGADMTGLRFSATYLFPGNIPTTFGGVWAPTGAASGASGSLPGPVLSLSGDSSASLAWVYSSQILSLLQSITLDGSAAGILFDRSLPNPGTPGSGPGADIAFGPLFQGGADAIVVTYSGAVSLNGNPPVNDLYSKLTIDFSALPLGGLIPQGFAFTQDSDLGVLTPEPPSSLFLLATFALGYLVRNSTGAKG